jgi:glycosyltransferase involved in cell wall biosynthesis
MSRVIHIVESLDRGAVENWLVRMYAYGRQRGEPLNWTFFCCNGAGRLDSLVEQLGARVIHSAVPLHRKISFCKHLREELRQGGYDVLHCHHDLVSAVYLVSAIGLPIKRRIVHVHNADEVVPVGKVWKQNLLREPLRRICWWMSDSIVGISQHTLDRFRLGHPRVSDWIHYYGVDATPFVRAGGDRVGLRRELGFSDDALIFLFAGRIDPEKNPLFAFDVFENIAARDPKIVALFAGTGRLAKELQEKAAASQFRERFRYVGWRDDVANLMVCSDLFILPHVESTLEGLGLAVVEAQLAGLPVLVSHGVADDPILPESSVRKLGLSESLDKWGAASLELLSGRRIAPAEAASALYRSPFNMDTAIADLNALHAGYGSITLKE